jgi:hypothetical protein
MTNILAQRAMLAFPSISLPPFRKLDKRASIEATETNGAESDSARVYKDLFPKHAIKGLVTVCGEARAYHYSMTLPWLDSGPRLLSALAYPSYADRMREFREAAQDQHKAMCNSYDSFVALAEHKLGGLFRLSDYPSHEEFAKRFSFETRIFNVPSSSDFRVDIGEAQAQAIRGEIEEATQQTINVAMAEAWGRIAKRVSAMAESLRAYQPELGVKGSPFRDSLVENVRELVALLPLLNVTADPGLDRMATRMQQELCAYDATELRHDPIARAYVAESAESILSDVSAFLA